MGSVHDGSGYVFLAELGDKTMLATVTLAARETSFVGVWIGSTLGMVLADAIAIWVGMVREAAAGTRRKARGGGDIHDHGCRHHWDGVQLASCL